MPRILVVDDEAANLEVVVAVLSGQDYRVHIARSGQQALDIAEQIHPDLILLDLMMPGIDGLQTCRQLKQIPALRDVPVIFLTAMDDEQHTIKGFEAGAVDYVTKPFNPRILLARVATHLKLLQHSRELAAIAQRDGLTGIGNRRAFDQRIDSEWRRSHRSHAGLGLLMMDVDYFKPYNDSYGHLQGDQALQQVAGIIESVAARAGDFPARYGGEEFALLSASSDRQSLQQLAEKVCQRVANAAIPHRSSKVSPVLTISIGGAWHLVTPEREFDSLIKAADRQLYKAKEQGRNQAVIEPEDPD